MPTRKKRGAPGKSSLPADYVHEYGMRGQPRYGAAPWWGHTFPQPPPPGPEEPEDEESEDDQEEESLGLFIAWNSLISI